MLIFLVGLFFLCAVGLTVGLLVFVDKYNNATGTQPLPLAVIKKTNEETIKTNKQKHAVVTFSVVSVLELQKLKKKVPLRNLLRKSLVSHFVCDDTERNLLDPGDAPNDVDEVEEDDGPATGETYSFGGAVTNTMPCSRIGL